ncbi:MAG: hypothetical protein ACT4PT_08450 [Methanobacteriota archaeon]
MKPTLANQMPAYLIAMMVLAPIAGADVVDTVLEAIPDPVPGDVQTRCDLALTVCATATAVASPVCTKVAPLTAQCTGAATVGGVGTSPTKLPGRVDGSGSGSASTSNGNSCVGQRPTGSNSDSWAGLLGSSGAGSPRTLSICTQVFFFLFGGCLSISVRADADASARVFVPGTSIVASSVSAPHAGETRSGSRCV